MGGFSKNVNFIQNCADWAVVEEKIKNLGNKEYTKLLSADIPDVRLAPITGGIENVGYSTEKGFYKDIVAAVWEAGCKISIGDGCPDIKLLSGIEAVKSLWASADSADVPKAAVFIKPYPQQRIFERMEWSAPVAEYIGVDIDSYSILTMRNLVKLEKKTAEQLIELKKSAAKKSIPFAVKGVFTREDVELVQEVRPDVIVISNHGGRVENRAGSSAIFMAKNAASLRNYCGQLWVDGGLRRYRDLQTAAYYGISQVMVGRPFISALCRGGSAEVRLTYEKLIKPER